MSEELKPCPFCGEKAQKLMGYDFHKVTCGNEFCAVYDVAFTVERWNTRHIPEGCDLSPELKERIDRIAENARWCQDTVIDGLVEWLCKEGHQGSKLRSQVERYKSMTKAAGNK